MSDKFIAQHKSHTTIVPEWKCKKKVKCLNVEHLHPIAPKGLIRVDKLYPFSTDNKTDSKYKMWSKKKKQLNYKSINHHKKTDKIKLYSWTCINHNIIIEHFPEHYHIMTCNKYKSTN